MRTREFLTFQCSGWIISIKQQAETQPKTRALAERSLVEGMNRNGCLAQYGSRRYDTSLLWISYFKQSNLNQSPTCPCTRRPNLLLKLRELFLSLTFWVDFRVLLSESLKMQIAESYPSQRLKHKPRR